MLLFFVSKLALTKQELSEQDSHEENSSGCSQPSGGAVLALML
jgi:hypothetical protein